MRWSPGKLSPNIEDRRGQRGGFGGMAPMGIGGAVLMLVLSLIFGGDIFSGGNDTDSAGGDVNGPVQESPGEAKEVQFVSFVVDTLQSTWARLLPQMGAQYRDAKLVLFRDATQTACGVGQSAMGPFYCPEDEKVYIDLSFYNDLHTRFGAKGDFAEAYVIAHEFGHHVQHLLGVDQQVRQAQGMDPRSANPLSVRLELQADCYAGVWAASARQDVLEPGDVEEGMNAAAAVGDDRIQRQTTGRVNGEAFTHGSSEQRMSWFRRGYDSGRPQDCDTFRR
jgi:predicted metalloprotease